MMTADIRQIRPYDFDPVDEASGIREPESAQVVRNGAARPFNDNARASGAEESPEPSDDLDSDPDADAAEVRDPVAARDPAASTAPRARRRGPLVTRWIGFAAHRRQMQDRTNRMRTLRNEGGSESSRH